MKTSLVAFYFHIFFLVFCNSSQKISNSNVIVPCVPNEGHTALVIGQDFYSIRNYTAALGNIPFGFMSYTALKSHTGSLTGLVHPIDYGSGIEWVQGLVDTYKGSAIQLGLWLVDSWDEIISGELDSKIDSLGIYLSSLKVPVYLRIGYEFDSYENAYPTEKYKKMFQIIVDRLKDGNVENVVFVWHASGFAPRDSLAIEEWYPGEEYVDWCGISLFQQPYECKFDYQCALEYADKVIKFCRTKNHPVMIAESSPFGGIIDEAGSDIDANHRNRESTNRAGYVGDSWERWFIHVLQYIEQRDIRMWCYIDCNWDEQPMWKKAHAPGVFWGDSRIEAYSGIKRKWMLEVLSSRRYSWISGGTKLIRDICHVHPKHNYLLAYHPMVIVGLTLTIFLLVLILIAIRLRRTRRRTDNYTVIIN